MPSKSWGNSVGSGSGATLTLKYDSIYQNSSGKAVLVNPRVEFYSKPGWSDSNNYIDVNGNAVVDALVHSGTLNGGTRTWNVTAEEVTLAYGSTVWKTFNARVWGISFFNGDGATTNYPFDVEFPARNYLPPRPPKNFTNTYVDDTRVNLAWTADWDGGAGAQPWKDLVIQRTLTGNWADAIDLVTLNWDALNYADRTIKANQRAGYRIKAVNKAGSSTWAYAAQPIYTTPAAPNQVTAAKQVSGSILVEAVNNARWGSKFKIQDSANGTSWTTLSSTLTEPKYTHNSPSTTVTHRYQMTAFTPDGKESAPSPVSNIVQLQAPPNAPTWGTLDLVYDATSPITTPWNHNPVDTTPQSAYEIQWRSSTNGGTTWSEWTTTGKITSLNQYREWAANVFPQNTLIELQVRTWGAHATASPWSASASFRTSARPMVGITSPASAAVLPGKSVTVKWNYADTEGTAQSAYEIRLYQGSDPLGLWQGSGEATEFTAPYELQDDTGYRIEVRARDGSGLWSAPSVGQFSVDYQPPAVPLVTYDWNQQNGSIVLNISNPDIAGKPPAVSNNVYRDGELIAVGVDHNTAFWDPLPLPAGSTYWVDALSALPSASRAIVETLPDPEVARRFWLNAGAGWGVVASFYGNVSRSLSVEVAREVEHFAGRSLPTETIGEARDDELSFSTTVVQTLDPPERFHEVVLARTTVCFRGDKARYFVSLPKMAESTTQNVTAGMSFSMRRTDYVEKVMGL